jgi:hypothetical protein
VLAVLSSCSLNNIVLQLAVFYTLGAAIEALCSRLEA